MKFTIGDKVLLKHTQEEGVISGELGGGMYEVTVGSISFPAYEDQLEHPYLKWFLEQRKAKKRLISGDELPAEKPQQARRLPSGIYLSFLPEFKQGVWEDVVERFKIHLLNELPVPLRFSYEVITAQGQSLFQHKGSIQGFGHVYLHFLSLEEASQQPRFHWQLEAGEEKEYEAASGTLRIRPAKLYAHVQELLAQNQPSFSYLLASELMPAPAAPATPLPKLKAPSKEPKATNPLLPPPRYEVDLHIEQLTSQYKGMSPAEMLRLQLETLEYFLHLAVVHHQERLFIIHGMGKGKLRAEVHRILKQMPEVSAFKNEWHPGYGYGATEVIFRL